MSVGELISIIWTFVQENWQLVVVAICWIVSLIINISKKKVTIKDAVFTMALKVLPNFIQIAEKKHPEGNGELKKELVVDSMIQFIMSVSDLSRKDVVSRYGVMIDSAIEDILACPAKKGE